MKNLGYQNIPEFYIIVPVSFHVIGILSSILSHKVCVNSITHMIAKSTFYKRSFGEFNLNIV